MRRKNWRIVIAGLVLIVIALLFFFFMLSVASKSNDPVALCRRLEQLLVPSAASASS
jgi:hypothetical protein